MIEAHSQGCGLVDGGMGVRVTSNIMREGEPWNLHQTPEPPMPDGTCYAWQDGNIASCHSLARVEWNFQERISFVMIRTEERSIYVDHIYCFDFGGVIFTCEIFGLVSSAL